MYIVKHHLKDFSCKTQVHEPWIATKQENKKETKESHIETSVHNFRYGLDARAWNGIVLLKATLIFKRRELLSGRELFNNWNEGYKPDTVLPIFLSLPLLKLFRVSYILSVNP